LKTLWNVEPAEERFAPPKADMCGAARDVCFGPIADDTIALRAPFSIAVVVLTEQEGKHVPDLETSLYSVSLLNDDETPMDFVVHVLEVFFDMDWDTAKQKMLLIHHHGTAECGFYPYELAKKKAADVVAFARQHNHPLRCTFEKALRTPEA
jgi:ATP-dependent Clp protease adaptor protein ClpS